jgi:ABC-type Zn uptake system ZnuABC Zn-binding protein ZnuA
LNSVKYLRLIWILFLLTSSCQSTASSSGTSAPVILTSTTFLADITRNVAGDRLTVESLLPIGLDPHSYQPTPQDAAKLSHVKMLIINGADYEQFLGPLLENIGGERIVVEASAGITPRQDAQGEADPHLWLDPNNVITYVENIRQALTQFDSEGAEIYQANADQYTRQLIELDAWIKQQVAVIPMDHRLLVTNHEALGYFSARYGFTVTGTVIESFSTDASPSAKQIAAIIDETRSTHTPAIFLDAGDNATLAEQIAAETGVRVVTDLHLESLTDGPPAATYLDMMKNNVTLIVNALQ